jgi:predicted alpha/beta-hydrolase family hydrolase
MALVRFAVDESTQVTGSLAGPRGAARATIVLGHGAGGDRTQESLVLLQRELAREDVRTLTFNFPYAERKKKLPDRMPVLEKAFRAAVAHARTLVAPGELLLAGGRSMGGRVASHLAAQGDALDGLVLLGYPLHAAGKPEKLRVEHLPRIACPVLFISGTQDELAPRELLERHVAVLGSRARLHWIEGADHGLDFPKRTGHDRGHLAGECARIVVRWIAEAVDAKQGAARKG